MKEARVRWSSGESLWKVDHGERKGAQFHLASFRDKVAAYAFEKWFNAQSPLEQDRLCVRIYTFRRAMYNPPVPL